MYPDFLNLLRVLEQHKVRYVVIGGYAVGMHAQPRYTKDLDILIEPSTSNAKKILNALQEFGAPISNLSVKDLATPGLLYVFGITPLRVDIINRIKGAKIPDIIKRAKKITVADTSLKLISIEDLIKLKKLAGRPQDIADISALQTARITKKRDK